VITGFFKIVFDLLNFLTGLLVNPGDEEMLRKSLLSLLRNPENRFRMGEKCLKRVKEKFSSAQMARQYMAVYHEAIGS